MRARNVPDTFPRTTTVPPNENSSRPVESSREAPIKLVRRPMISTTPPAADVMRALLGISIRTARPGSPVTIAVPAKAAPPKSTIPPPTLLLPLCGSSSIWPPPEAGKAARLKSSFVVISMESGTLRSVSVNAVGAPPPAHSRQLPSPAASSNGNSPNAPQRVAYDLVLS